MKSVYAPRETVSDQVYRVVRWLVTPGDFVNVGDKICELESSKSIFTVEANAQGFLKINAKEDEEVFVGAEIATISEVRQDYVESISNCAEKTNNCEIRISNMALELMKQNQLTPDDFAPLNVVKVSDVQNLLASRKNSPNKKLQRDMLRLSAKATNTFILGGGGHAKMCIEILEANNTMNVVGILDSILPIGSEVLGIPVVGDDSDGNLLELRRLGVTHSVNGVGMVKKHKKRCKVNQRLLDFGFLIPTIIHPTAIVEKSCSLSWGCQIMAGAILGSDSKIGDCCIINSGAIVSHDCVIEAEVHIAPGAILGGAVTVGQRTLIGMGVTVLLGLKIGSDIVIPNGTAVNQNLQ